MNVEHLPVLSALPVEPAVSVSNFMPPRDYGSSAALHLGTTRLDATTLDRYNDTLTEWGNVLIPDGICNLGQMVPS